VTASHPGRAADESEDVVLSTEAVTRRYDDTIAVDGVSLSVRDGEFFSLLGPSGCGKTTTLLMLAGLETPDEGVVRLAGRDVTDRPARERDTNLVFQDLVLFPHMTVAENVGYGPARQGVLSAEREARVEELLSVVGLSGMGERDPAELSGGQRQRVALARALANEPSVLLLDEPLSSLDRPLREELQTELKRIQRGLGTTFLYVTHDQASAMSMSDRVAVMDRGCVVEVGAPDRLYERPETSFVAEFLGDGSVLRIPVTGSETGRTVDLAGTAVPVVGEAKGGEVAVAVRPEDVTLGEGPLVAEVVRTAYRRFYEELTVELSDGTRLALRGEDVGVRAGETLRLGVDRVRAVRDGRREVS
jgi:spermidine/putrescine transport system ATP-binding protein